MENERGVTPAISAEALRSAIDKPVFHLVGEAADSLGRECYVVGGYVRDIMLRRPSTDVDFVTVGSGIEVASEVARRLKGSHLSVFRNYGTAQVKRRSVELEFVGARKESYHRESRNPVVEDGTLDDEFIRFLDVGVLGSDDGAVRLVVGVFHLIDDSLQHRGRGVDHRLTGGLAVLV